MAIVTIKNGKLTALLTVFRRFALKMEAMTPQEHGLVMALLMRHCQARLGLTMDAPSDLPKPPNPERAVLFFRTLATELETMTGTDNTLIVNLLLQAWQRRAAVALDDIKDLAKQQEDAVVH